MLLLIYCNKTTPRTEYIFSVLLAASGITYSFTTDKEQFSSSTEAKLNYSDERITVDEFWIKPFSLLFENNIHEQQINCFDWNGLKAFYQTPRGDFPFDLFAAAFYLITCYEEYLPHKLDMYGRYAHENSLAYRQGFLHLPVVNIWLKEFVKALKEKFPQLQATPTSFRFLPTYDIDIAWSYLHKGLMRNAGGAIRSLVNGEWSRVKERVRVMQGKQQDPFDSYEWLNELHEAYGLEPVYFFLVARQTKDYDKNILPSCRAMQRLIREHSEKYDIGIHPSWQSGDEAQLLQEEIQSLRKITAKPITKSRQHYIRMHLPNTYEKLIAAGITEDYSMGYGSINGFRASYCLPFRWYNLKEEKATPLTIFPFCFMDANSYYEQHYSSKQAEEEMRGYANVVKAVNGLFVCIWHNHFLGTDKMFGGWSEAYNAVVTAINKE